MRPTSFDGFDGANDGVSAMLTQINRSKEQVAPIKFQKLVITLCKEQGGIVLINARKEFEFVKTSECASEKLREWCCNRDSHKMSIHHTRFAVKDPRREKKFAGEQGRITELSHAFQRGTRMIGQVVHTCVLEKARQVGWQKEGVINPMFWCEGFDEHHRSVIVDQQTCRNQRSGWRCWTLC